jgi:segregation and condensation protein B
MPWQKEKPQLRAVGFDDPLVDAADFEQPDDQGLPLNELSQAYAALLSKGTDPYSERPAETQPSEPEAIAPSEQQGSEQQGPAADPDAAFAITPRSILEAMLFVGHPTGESLTSERIAGLMRGVRPAEIDDLVKELNAEYAADGAAYDIRSVGPGYQLALRPQFGPLRDLFLGRIREARLSQAAIDILAIVAYHQPVTAAEIDRLRGKPSGSIISQLVRRDLLTIERSTEKGAKPQYRTTTRFLDLFGLKDTSELPRSHDVDRDL